MPSHAAAASPAAEARPFDDLAAGYDDVFTHSVIGTLLRRSLQRRLLAAFQAGDRVLELACGTGEDAVHLGRHGVRVLATDASPSMVAAAKRKVEAAGLQDLVEVRQLAVEELSRLGERGPAPPAPSSPPSPLAPLPPLASLSPLAPLPLAPLAPLSPPAPLAPLAPLSAGLPFDGAFSSFGGFNCIADARGPARDLAALLRPGARVLLCVMGPFVPWEWGWFLLRGRPGKAFRRLRRGGAAWRGMVIRYPSIGAMRRAFEPEFQARRTAAIGVLLPPSYAEPWAARHPRLLARLDRWERRWETLPPLPWLADHYLLELERR